MNVWAEVVPASGSRLTVLSRDGTYVECQCTCGAVKRLRVDGVRSGAVRSCGCLSRETKQKRGEWNREQGKLTEEQVTELVEVYKLGYDVADIAECLGTTYGLVYSLLKHRGEIRRGGTTILGTPRKARGELGNLSREEKLKVKNAAERAYYAKWKEENPEAWRLRKEKISKRKRDDYAKNKAENSEDYRRWLNTRAAQIRDQMYGLAPGQWDQMLIEQSGRCGICNRPMKSPHVDHDHISGEVRELLCGPCNQGLGGFQDRRSVLFQVVAYLARHGR